MMQILVLWLLLLPLQSFAQSKRVRELFKDKTSIENPFDLRDPFKKPLFRVPKTEKEAASGMLRDGIYTNIPPVGELNPSQLRIVGVLIGKERRALAKIGEGKDLIILKEGMKIGEDSAELKAILPGGIILVEKIVNVYGEEEYLETVIPISR